MEVDTINEEPKIIDFKIEKKEPKCVLKDHTDYISCSTVLNDGRFATGSKDKSIIIYNKDFKKDLVIREHSKGVRCLIQLNSGELVSGSEDNEIKIYKIEKDKYQVIQTLKYHKNWVNKIIKLKNNQLVSCSFDGTIIFYTKDENNLFKMDFSIPANGYNGPIIQTKENEICFYEDNKTLCFYDIKDRKDITKINDINASFYNYDCLLMLSKDLLLVTGKEQITIVDLNKYEVKEKIDVSGSGLIFAACMLNEKTILTSDENKRIIKWEIEGNNLKLISMIINAHEREIYTLSKLKNGSILSAGYDRYVKIW
jgi:WD40 repeat protein